MHQLHDAKLLEGKQFIDNEQYEEAVIAYQTLLGTEYDTLAQEGIQLAQDLYAEQHRREAASLVLKAHEDSDMASRKGLLVQALRMLQDINVRYPGNKYAAKVQQNIKDVVEQIQGMDPSFDPYGPTGITREEDPRAKVISQ
jgi:thioredoxin-like negative regulator of GroEL